MKDDLATIMIQGTEQGTDLSTQHDARNGMGTRKDWWSGLNYHEQTPRSTN